MEMFSYAFVLRKPCPLLKTLLQCFEDLTNRGFLASITLPEGADARWIEFRAYERSSIHSTLVVNRMLATVPNQVAKNAISIFNFGLAYKCPLRIEVQDDNKSFRISLLPPKRPQQQQSVEDQIRLLNF